VNISKTDTVSISD